MIPSTGGRSQAHSMKLMGLLSFATEILNDQVKLVFLMETLIKKFNPLEIEASLYQNEGDLAPQIINRILFKILETFDPREEES